MSDDLPERPKAPEPLTYKTPDVERSVARAIATIAVVIALVAGIGAYFWTMTADPVVVKAKPVVTSPSPTRAPINNSTPCSNETFDKALCAERLIKAVVQQYGVPPAVVVETWCKDLLSTKKGRREQAALLVRHGDFTKANAKAVIDQLHGYCR